MSLVDEVSFLEESQLTFYNLQPDPASIVVIAIGLAGTEESPYFVDLISHLDRRSLIIGVRGSETCAHTFNRKIFLKNDSSRISATMRWVYAAYPTKPKIGIGMSLGGALVLRHQSLKLFPFDEIIMISTSLWYEHAIRTMPDSFKGILANRILSWWQFERLYFGKNYLTTTRRPTIQQWIRLLLSSNMLQQDKILCELYDMDYESYINDLDMRWMTKEVRSVNYLLSKRDPMFSGAHLKVTLDALEGSLFNYSVVQFGSHGEFTKNTRNDYLVEYCQTIIDKVCSLKYPKKEFQTSEIVLQETNPRTNSKRTENAYINK